MAEILGLNGKPLEEIAEQTPLSVLKGIVAKIESGDLNPDKILVITEVTVREDRAKVNHPTFDNGLTIAQVVFLLETAKADIFDMIRV